MKGGKVSFTAFEAHWLQTILATINPIEIDALEYVKLPLPKQVVDDPSVAWENLIGKIDAIAPGVGDD